MRQERGAVPRRGRGVVWAGAAWALYVPVSLAVRRLSGACVAVAIAACSTGSTGGGSSDGGPAAGSMGAPCGAGVSCGMGLTCITAWDSEQYCAPPCSAPSDCNAFAQTSYTIGVPDSFTPLGGDPTPTHWASSTDLKGVTLLTRGAGCAGVIAPQGGAKYCEFTCPNFAAVNHDTGNCNCLPGYSLSADKKSCVYGTSENCSIFTYLPADKRATLQSQYGIQTQGTVCDACNSDTSFTDTVGCHSNTFFCNIITNGLNGNCAEGLTMSQLQQCKAAKTNFDCSCPPDPCVDACSDPSSCTGCCTCNPTSSLPPKPACNAGSSSSSGGSSGGSSGNGSSGASSSSGSGTSECGTPPRACSTPVASGAVATSSCFYSSSIASGYTYPYDDGCTGSTACVDPQAMCASGTTVAGTNCWGSGWGVNMNMDVNGNTIAPGKVDSAAFSYAVTSVPPGGIQVNLLAPSGPCSAAATGNDGCCATITTTSGTIPWSSFIYHCYNPPPNAPVFDPAGGLAAINFQSNNSTPGAWSYCVTHLQLLALLPRSETCSATRRRA